MKHVAKMDKLLKKVADNPVSPLKLVRVNEGKSITSSVKPDCPPFKTSNITLSKGVENIDIGKFTKHINLLESADDTYVMKKNSDGRKGVWLISDKYKYKILLANSGTSRIFFVNLTSSDFNLFKSEDVVVKTKQKQVLAPSRPEKFSDEKLFSLVKWAISLHILKSGK